jgi:hypothetical protein
MSFIRKNLNFVLIQNDSEQYTKIKDIQLEKGNGIQASIISFTYSNNKDFVCDKRGDDTKCFYKNQESDKFFSISYTFEKKCSELNTYYFEEKNQFLMDCKIGNDYNLYIFDGNNINNNIIKNGGINLYEIENNGIQENNNQNGNIINFSKDNNLNSQNQLVNEDNIIISNDYINNKNKNINNNNIENKINKNFSSKNKLIYNDLNSNGGIIEIKNENIDESSDEEQISPVNHSFINANFENNKLENKIIDIKFANIKDKKKIKIPHLDLKKVSDVKNNSESELNTHDSPTNDSSVSFFKKHRNYFD